jgi:hypothetical protein
LTYIPALSQTRIANARHLTLRREITALRLREPLTAAYDSAKFVELPKGAELSVCGAGFNNRTVMIRWQGDSYYVFEQDLVQDDRVTE